jgi:CRISPR-associated protein Csx17
MASIRLKSISFDGVRPDSLGNYFVGLGLLSALSKKWQSIRGCWRNGRFCALERDISRKAVEYYLLNEWIPTDYERWWKESQEKSKKNPKIIWSERSSQDLNKVVHLDAHIITVERNQFNPIFGTGGNIGKRNLAKTYREALDLIDPPMLKSSKNARKSSEQSPSSPLSQICAWLRLTLWGEGDPALPEPLPAGTWFVSANKSFNSGQSWYCEERISPWSFILAMEGALMLVGGVNRRLSALARPYAVFPFISEAPSPKSDGEIKSIEAEFWAPIWKYPATLTEVRSLLERGLARIGDKTAKAPHEFALAARSAGVDAGVSEFARFILRHTTSSQTYEAIPQQRIEVAPVKTIESQLIEPLLPWLDRLPYEPRDPNQRGQFKGLRGPIEELIIQIAEKPEDPERWRNLLLRISDTQARIDRSKDLRGKCDAIPRLDPRWFDRAWSEAPPEVQIARAIASIGAGTDMPLMLNIYGVELNSWGKPFFPREKPQRAVWYKGDPVRLLCDLLHRRLVDGEPTEKPPLKAIHFCDQELMEAFLAGQLNLEMICQWIPPFSLIAWERQKERDDSFGTISSPAASPMYLLSAFFKPIFHPDEIALNGRTSGSGRFSSSIMAARRLFNLIRQGEWDEAVKFARNRYLAQGFATIQPELLETGCNELMAASFLVPLRGRDVTAGFKRWLEPGKKE